MKTRYNIEELLQEIENGNYRIWNPEKTKNTRQLLIENAALCTRKLTDGDLNKAVRLELSCHHQRVIKALSLLTNTPVIVPPEFTEVKFNGRIEPKNYNNSPEMLEYVVKENPELEGTETDSGNWVVLGMVAFWILFLWACFLK